MPRVTMPRFRFLEEAHRQLPDRDVAWLAGNAVDWFSKRWTDEIKMHGRSHWDNRFERVRIDDRWAYRAKPHSAPAIGAVVMTAPPSTAATVAEREAGHLAVPNLEQIPPNES